MMTIDHVCERTHFMINNVTGLENAKTMGWLLEMHLPDTATFLPCIVTGNYLLIFSLPFIF